MASCGLRVMTKVMLYFYFRARSKFATTEAVDIIYYNKGIIMFLVFKLKAPPVVWFDRTIIVYHYYPVQGCTTLLMFCFCFLCGVPAWRLI